MQVTKMRIEEKIIEIVNHLREHPNLYVRLENKKTRLAVSIMVRHDEIKIRKILGRNKKLARAVIDIEHQIKDNAELLSVQIAKTKEDLLNLLERLAQIYAAKDDIVRTFDRFYEEKCEEIKELDKEIHKHNSRIYAENKEQRERELEALQRSDYDNVRDDILKRFIKTEFPRLIYNNITIIDKSSKHRAILGAGVTYINGTWYVDGLFLCGKDDNADMWIHIIPKYDMYELCVSDRLEDMDHLSVKRIMAYLWRVKNDIIEKAQRQGDLLVWEIDRHEVSKEQLTEYEVVRNHIIKGLLRVGKIGDMETVVKTVTECKLEHTSHASIILEPNRTYILKPLPQDAD